MNVDNRERERINPVTLGVVVPMLQAIITGVLAGVFTAAVAYAVGSKFIPALGFGLIAAIVVTLLMWLVLFLGRWQPLLEEILQSDLNHDGVIGPLEPTVQPRKEIRLSIESENRTSFLDLPFDETELRRFVTLCLQDRTSVVAMVNAGISRPALEEARFILMERGYAEWKAGGENQGWRLTKEGTAAFRAYYRSPHP